jgi:cytochrome P450
MLDEYFILIRGHGLVVCISLIGLYLLHNWYGRGLHRFNGPFLATLSSGWRVWDVWRRGDQVPYLYLHRRYGVVVRIGPNRLSFQDPTAVKDIYGPNGGLIQKSDMHMVAQQTSRGEAFQTLFATKDAVWHNNLRRKVNSAFSMSTMVQYEKYVDETVSVLLEQLEGRFATSEGFAASSLDFPAWMHFYTEDAVTNVTYGKRMGFLEKGDAIGLLAATNKMLLYTIYVMQWPVLDLWLRKNVVKMWLNKHGWFNRQASETVPFALTAQRQRRELRVNRKLSENRATENTLTDKFLAAQEKHPESFGPRELLALGLSIIAAGSETTAITLSALFYYVLKNPTCHFKLQVEVDTNFPPGTPITFSHSQKLPYLSAVLKETFRMHPASVWAPERVVPAGGHTIAGERIPSGTVVSVSAWVIHRDVSIFGEDADEFRPERWLAGGEDQGEEPAKIKNMERHLLHFGAGAYTCIGRNIALMEIYRVVPALLRKFEMALVDPNKDWRFLTGSFVNVADFEVRLKTRTR